MPPPELVGYLNWLDSDSETMQDPNERRRLALAEIDKAPFGWYHIRAIVVAGIGFFTDAYDVSSNYSQIVVQDLRRYF